MLDCPNCGELLSPLFVHDKTRATGIELDHCIHCGGTWFDSDEINKISYSDIFKIASSTLIKKREAPWGKMERLCPRDFNTLSAKKPEFTHENITIEQCPKCRGMFLMEKDLEKLKLAQNVREHAVRQNFLSVSYTKTIMLTSIFGILLLASTFFTLTKSRNQSGTIQASEEVYSVVTIPLPDQGESILFLTKSSQKTSLEYWSDPNDKKEIVISSFANTSHQVTLHNLQANTRYIFRIKLSEANQKPIYSKEFSFTYNE